MAEDIAAILAKIRAAQDEHRAHPGAVSAIHVLILACFAHIFLMLEVMVAQWSAGLLPAPTHRTPRRKSARAIATHEATQRPDCVRTPRRAAIRLARVGQAVRAIARAMRAPRHHPIAHPIPTRAVPSRPAPVLPTPLRVQKPAWTTSPTHAQIVPLS